ncbi:hypothetical protein [Paracoccus pantotrophus]|uniref:hypothetical protein n=1 Tax=Paracoccus pantotrophus TaxID=82367 RepID=UPI000463FD7B|nr:hypothetical protein [Paracoccus pantotrophus]
MKDLHSSLSVAAAIDVATLTDDSTPVAIDLRGHDGAEIILAIGAGGITFTSTNRIEFILTHSDDDSSYEAVTAPALRRLRRCRSRWLKPRPSSASIMMTRIC